VVQAAIAACHALAPTSCDTDWAAVLSWYDVLLTVHDTPVVRLNRAVAVGECRGPQAAMAELDSLATLSGYPLWHATRAELLVRLERVDEARTAFDEALALPLGEAQQRHVAGRRAALVDEAAGESRVT
jgi:predicted RNA polymerase sigma factor